MGHKNKNSSSAQRLLQSDDQRQHSWWLTLASLTALATGRDLCWKPVDFVATNLILFSDQNQTFVANEDWLASKEKNAVRMMRRVNLWPKFTTRPAVGAHLFTTIV